MDIIVQAAYNHPTLPAPSLPSPILKELLIICTTETPFQFRGETYVQIDEVSMGCPQGPTFADFYMSHLENAVLSLNRVSNPVFYRRYVDDILAVFTTDRQVNLFNRRLEHSSVLKFLHMSQ